MRHPTLPTSHKPPQLRHSENKAPDVVNGDCAAHPNRRLYLNLLAPAEDQEQELFYDFFPNPKTKLQKEANTLIGSKSLIS